MPDLVFGVPVAILVPAMVEAAKAAGLPTKYAGLAAIAAAALLLLLLVEAGLWDGNWAAIVAGALVDGLAAAGLYSQVKRATAP